jgi:hypothetical protein
VSCGVLHFSAMLVSLLKRNEIGSMTSQPTKLKLQPNPFSAFRQASEHITCYVVVVAVVLDNLGALVPASSYPRIFRSAIDRVT